MRALALIALMPLLAAGCQKPVVVDLTVEEAALRELSTRWNVAVEARDVGSICPLFAENAVEMQANTPVVTGSAAICEWYRGWLLDPAVTASFKTEDFDVAASGDLAIERGSYQFRTTKGDSTTVDDGKYLTVWKKIDGRWKVLYDMANTNLPLPAAP